MAKTLWVFTILCLLVSVPLTISQSNPDTPEIKELSSSDYEELRDEFLRSNPGVLNNVDETVTTSWHTDPWNNQQYALDVNRVTVPETTVATELVDSSIGFESTAGQTETSTASWSWETVEHMVGASTSTSTIGHSRLRPLELDFDHVHDLAVTSAEVTAVSTTEDLISVTETTSENSFSAGQGTVDDNEDAETQATTVDVAGTKPATEISLQTTVPTTEERDLLSTTDSGFLKGVAGTLNDSDVLGNATEAAFDFDDLVSTMASTGLTEAEDSTTAVKVVGINALNSTTLPPDSVLLVTESGSNGADDLLDDVVNDDEGTTSELATENEDTTKGEKVTATVLDLDRIVDPTVLSLEPTEAPEWVVPTTTEADPLSQYDVWVILQQILHAYSIIACGLAFVGIVCCCCIYGSFCQSRNKRRDYTVNGRPREICVHEPLLMQV